MSAGGLFISSRSHLQGSGGGVQICTREYMRVIEAAGVDLSVLPFEPDRSLTARIGRRLNSSPYYRPFESTLLGRIEEASKTSPNFVFLNQVAISGLASAIRPLLPRTSKIVVLSHGAEIVDLLHMQRLRRKLPLTTRFRPNAAAAIGRVLQDEAGSRRDVDLVINLSPFDTQMETWFGSHASAWLPRVIAPSPLTRTPIQNRFGFVGTLDHAPNLEGLVMALEAMAVAAPHSEVRIVGGSHRVSRWLADRFTDVEYLGPLDDLALAAEAATWSAFLHPIFCAARGCSTKLAKAIEWQIPIVTTPLGRRGYVWGEGELIEVGDAEAFGRACAALLDPAARDRAALGVARVAASSPALSSVASQMRQLLGHGSPLNVPHHAPHEVPA